MPDSRDYYAGYDKPKPKTPPPSPPKEWDPTSFQPPPVRSGPDKHQPVPPPIPGGSGKGKTSVDTPSMKLFADNMEALKAPVMQAYEKLTQLPVVNPGSFYDGYMLRQVSCGANGDSGLQNTYIKILHDLGQGLADIASGVRQLSANYSTVEEESKMTADELNKALESAQGDFTKIGSGG